MKKIYFILLALLITPGVVFGQASTLNRLDQWVSTTSPTAITQRVINIPIKISGLTPLLPLCLDSNNLITNTGCTGGAGGGGGAGTFSTTTSSVSGQLINYSNNTTDIVTVGSNSTTTAEFYFDPNTNRFIVKSGTIGVGTTTPYAPLSVVGQIVGSYFTGTSITATSTFGGGVAADTISERTAGGGITIYSTAPSSGDGIIQMIPVAGHGPKVIIGAGNASIGSIGNFSNTIIGGDNGPYTNIILDNAYLSSIFGGYDHIIGNGAIASTINGGGHNQIGVYASSTHGVISGGSYNIIGNGDYQYIGGGTENRNDGYGSTIGGGVSNTASSTGGTVAGGSTNFIKSPSNYATIGGGYNNKVNGLYGTVPGGLYNEADANYTFAAGRKAIASSTGSFALTDSTDNYFYVNQTNTLGARFASGYWLTGGNLGVGTIAPAAKIHASSTGAMIRVDDTTPQAAGVGGGVSFGGNYRTNNDVIEIAKIKAEKTNSTNNHYGYNLRFYTTLQGGTNPNPNPVATMSDTGYLGIGTTTPYKPLSVVGAGGVVAETFYATSTTATSTFANGINLTGGCLAVNGTCFAGGGGGSANPTITTTLPFTNCEAQTDSYDFAPGGAYIQPIYGATFTNGTSSAIACDLTIPDNVSATPNGVIMPYLTATTTGNSVFEVNATTTSIGQNWIPTSYTNLLASTSAASRIAVTGGANYPLTSTTTISTNTLNIVAGSILKVRFVNYHADANDTVENDLFMPKAVFKFDIKVN